MDSAQRIYYTLFLLAGYDGDDCNTPHMIYMGYIVTGGGEQIEIFLALAGAKRAAAITEAINTCPRNIFCASFDGMDVICYDVSLYGDPNSCVHIIKSNNSRNLLTSGLSIPDKMVASRELMFYFKTYFHAHDSYSLPHDSWRPTHKRSIWPTRSHSEFSHGWLPRLRLLRFLDVVL